MSSELILTILQTLVLFILILYIGNQLIRRIDKILEKLESVFGKKEDYQEPVDDNLDYPYPVIARELAKQKETLSKEQTPEAKERLQKIEKALNRGWFQFADQVARVFIQTEGEISFERLLKAVFEMQYPNFRPRDMGGGLEMVRAIKGSVERTTTAFVELGYVLKAGENYQTTKLGQELFERILKERIEFEEKFLTLFSDRETSTPGCSDNRCVFLIRKDTDDASEVPGESTCAFSTANENIYLGECDHRESITAGLRFVDIDIPPSAIIEKAYLEFVADGPYDNSVSLSIHAENRGDVNTFSDIDQPYNRPATETSIAWNITSKETWILGRIHTSPDISTVIQSILDRPDWQRGNAIAILIKNAEGGDRNAHRRIIGYHRARMSPEYDSPKLIIEYK